MPPLLLYSLVVIIWSGTWFAMKLQISDIPSEVSIFYRIALSAIIMLIFCKIKKYKLNFSVKEHFFIVLLGLLLFSNHLIFMYHGSHYLISGLVAVIFSMTSVFNILNNFLFFRKAPEKRTLLGSMFGISGIILVFWTEIFDIQTTTQTLIGVSLCLTGTYIFSVGNVVSKRNHLDLIASNTLGLCYASVYLFLYCLFTGKAFIMPHEPTYIGSLLYLAILGTAIAFLSYLTLVKQIGPEKAGYATVFFPLLALVVSSIFEGYSSSLTDALGFTLVVSGNILILGKKQKPISLST